MVPAVDRGLGSPGDAGEPRPRRDATRWSRRVFSSRVRCVDDRRRALARDVLHERAAEGDVDDLEAAADPEDRAPGPLRLFEEPEVEVVALGVDLDGPVLERRPAVPGGIDVHAAPEHEGVERHRAAGDSGVTTSIASRGTPAATSDRR